MELKHKRWNKWETKIYIVNAEERDRSEDIFTDIPIKISAQHIDDENVLWFFFAFIYSISSYVFIIINIIFCRYWSSRQM